MDIKQLKVQQVSESVVKSCGLRRIFLPDNTEFELVSLDAKVLAKREEIRKDELRQIHE